MGKPNSWVGVRGSLRERFLRKVSVGESGCCPWIGSIGNGGYGQIWDGRLVQAHRVAYQLYVGRIPEGLVVDHACHNTNCSGGKSCPHRRCVNPAHLEVVTQSVNLKRGQGAVQLRERNTKTHCLRGHDFADAYIRPDGRGRCCRECQRLRAKATS